jgi:tRNA threonylcarbamoyladenosine biosynthesis protein TsaE
VGHQLAAVDVTVVGGGVVHDADVNQPIVKTILWPDEAATASFANAMAQTFTRGLAQTSGFENAFIELHGGLGAGKTTFVRHLLHALGVQGRIKSPTYAVVESYELPEYTPPLNIWHFDFYRFNDPNEWEDAGFRDIFASPGLKLAEWPNNAAQHLPKADWVMQLEVLADESRQATIATQTPLGLALLQTTLRTLQAAAPLQK